MNDHWTISHEQGKTYSVKIKVEVLPITELHQSVRSFFLNTPLEASMKAAKISVSESTRRAFGLLELEN